VVEPSPDRTLVLTFEDHATEVTAHPVILGRDSACDIQLQTSLTSRFHAAVFRVGRTWQLRDFRSKNGTTLNGQNVAQAQVRPGDIIEVGDCKVTVSEGSKAVLPYSNIAVVALLDVANATSTARLHGDAFLTAMEQALEALTTDVIRRRGCVVKTLGSGLLVGFSLWPTEDRRYSAADEAVAFAREAGTVVSRMAIPGADLKLGVRVGIAAERVVVNDENGFDVSGDAVDLAARMEALNRTYGTSIMMSGLLFQALRKKRFMREIDTVQFKDRADPLVLFAHDALAEAQVTVNTAETTMREVERKASRGKLYQQGLQAYRAGEFVRARFDFEVAASLGDVTGAAMQARVEEFLRSPPANWKGVWPA
jgi:class 3 adenylate cyclase